MEKVAEEQLVPGHLDLGSEHISGVLAVVALLGLLRLLGLGAGRCDWEDRRDEAVGEFWIKPPRKTLLGR